MDEVNPFDQFDEVAPAPVQTNPFDEFEDYAEESYPQPQAQAEADFLPAPTEEFGRKGEEEVGVPGLPEPRMEMYAGIESPEDQEAYYNAYKRHPKSEIRSNPMEGEQVYYKGKLVPSPSTALATQAQTGGPDLLGRAEGVGKGAVDVAAGALYEAPRRLGERVEALTRQGLETTGIVDEGKDIFGREFTPQYEGEYEPLVSEDLVDAGSTLAGAAAGGAGGALIKTVTTVGRWLAVGGGAVLGETFGKTAGEDRMIGGLFDEKKGRDGKGGANDFEILMNDLTDASVMAGLGAGAGALVGKVGAIGWNSIIKPLVVLSKTAGGQGEEAMAEQIGRQFVELSRLAQGAKNPEERAQLIQQMADILKTNADSLTTIDEKDYVLMNDLAAAAEQGGAGKLSSETIEELRNLRMGSRASGQSGKLQSRLAQPFQQTEDAMTEAAQARGGREGIENAAKTIQTGAQEDIGAARAAIEQSDVDIDRLGKESAEAVQTEELLGPKLSQASKDPSLDFGREKDALASEVVTDVETLTKAEKAVRNQKWDDIPDGIDTALIRSDFDSIAENISDKKLLQVIEQYGDDFGQLQRQLGKPLSDALSRAHIAGSPETPYLQELKKELREGMPDKLAELAKVRAGQKKASKPLKAGVDAVQEAARYTREEFGPGVDSGIPKEIDVKKKTIGFDKPTYEDEARKVVTRTLRGEDPSRTKHLIETVRKGISKGTLPKEAEGRMFNLAIAESTDKLRSKLKETGGLEGLKAGEITESLKDARNVLREYPEQLQKINDLEQKLLANQTNVKKLEELLPSQIKNLDDIEYEVHQGVLKDFFKDKAPREGITSFKSLLKDPDNRQKVVTILKKGDEAGPEIRQAMKSSWIREYQDKLFHPTKKVGSARAVDISVTREAEKGTLPDWDFAKEIFSDEPETFEALKDLSTKVSKLQSSMTDRPGLAPFEYTRFTKEASQASDRIITSVFGVLNKIATKLRIAKGAALESVEMENLAKRVGDKFYADPLYAAEVLAKIAKSDKPMTSPANKIILKTWLMQGWPENERPTEEDVDAVLNDMATDEQTGEALKK